MGLGAEGAADADEGEDSVVVLVEDEGDAAGQPVLHQAQFYVCLFEEPSLYGNSPASYHSTSVHFHAMLASAERGSLCIFPVLVSAATLAVQLVLLNGYIFAYYVNVPDADWNTFSKLFSADVAGGFPELLAVLVSLAVAPFVVLVKMERNNELEQMPAFRATMRALFDQDPPEDSVPVRHRGMLYVYWTLVYVLRAYWVLPFVVYANAVVVVNTASVRLILIMVLVSAFLLELDDQAYKVFFSRDARTGKARPHASVLLCGRTGEACREVRLRMAYLLAFAQAVLTFAFKVQRWAWLLTGLPVLGWLMSTMLRTAFSTEKARTAMVGDHELHFVLAFCWLWVMYSAYYLY